MTLREMIEQATPGSRILLDGQPASEDLPLANGVRVPFELVRGIHCARRVAELVDGSQFPIAEGWPS